MMVDTLMSVFIFIIELFIAIGIFAILVKVSKLVVDKVNASDFLKTSRLFNPAEYFPDEELSTIRQIFYLVIIVLIVVDILYSVVGWNQNIIIFSVFDILLSLHFAIHVNPDSSRNKILLFGQPYTKLATK